MKCRLLFNEEPITINRLAAKVLGLNEAIVVQQIHYWLNINEKAKINMYDGRVWSFSTYEKWQNDNFDFWSLSTLKRIFKSLFDKGILLKGNYNKKKYDKTLWVSLDYKKLNDMLEEYEKNNVLGNEEKQQNVEISTECQNDIMSDSNIVSDCYYGECQVDTMESVNLTLPIQETTKEITKEICTTHQKDAVVETNKEIIESNTHLVLDSNNKISKVSKWKKDRLLKAIDIFKREKGVYFSLLEKIYKSDKNFANYETNDKKVATKQVKTRHHNINQTFEQYTPEELDNIIAQSQKEKFNLVATGTDNKDANIKELYALAISENKIDELTEISRYLVIEYAKKNNLFIPKTWTQ